MLVCGHMVLRSFEVDHQHDQGAHQVPYGARLSAALERLHGAPHGVSQLRIPFRISDFRWLLAALLSPAACHAGPI